MKVGFDFVMVSFANISCPDITPEMAAKGAKETFVNKLGFKSSHSKSVELEVEKLKRENQQLKKSLEDTKRAGRHQNTQPDPDKAKLLEVNSCLYNVKPAAALLEVTRKLSVCLSGCVYADFLLHFSMTLHVS